MTDITPSEALVLLRRLRRACTNCRTLDVNLVRAVADHRNVVRKAIRDESERDWSSLIERAEQDVAGVHERAVKHLAEPHAEPEQKPRPTPVAEQPDHRVECPRCGVKTNLKRPGVLTQHRGPSGMPCPRRHLMAVTTDLLAEAEAMTREGVNRQPARPPAQPRSPRDPARLDAGSECVDCGRWLPGERSLCGRCANHRARAG